MGNQGLSIKDQIFLNEWKRLWVKGSFLTYLSDRSLPIGKIMGKIKRSHQWGVSNQDLRHLLDEAFSQAKKPIYSRYEELATLIRYGKAR